MKPYVVMGAWVQIGNLEFGNVESIRIEESLTELGSKAVITIARNYRRLDGKSILDYIAPGMRVAIKLGYDEELEREFLGYVANVGAETPVEIRCEDEFYPLKRKTIIKSWSAISLKAMLGEIAPGFTIDCGEMNLGKFEIDNASAYEVLRRLQQDYGLYTRLSGNVLTVGFTWDWKSNIRHTYHAQGDVKKSNLEWRRAEDVKLNIKVVYYDGKHKKTLRIGDSENGSSTINASRVASSEADAKSIGRSILDKSRFDGFTGSITGFCEPRTHAGDSLELKSPLLKDKEGTYLIEKVIVTYNQDGISRENTLAKKLQ